MPGFSFFWQGKAHRDAPEIDPPRVSRGLPSPPCKPLVNFPRGSISAESAPHETRFPRRSLSWLPPW